MTGLLKGLFLVAGICLVLLMVGIFQGSGNLKDMKDQVVSRVLDLAPGGSTGKDPHLRNPGPAKSGRDSTLDPGWPGDDEDQRTFSEEGNPPPGSPVMGISGGMSAQSALVPASFPDPEIATTVIDPDPLTEGYAEEFTGGRETGMSAGFAQTPPDSSYFMAGIPDAPAPARREEDLTSYNERAHQALQEINDLLTH
jgi:hypothetical protein